VDSLLGARRDVASPESTYSFVRLDADGRICEATPAASSMLGFEPMALAGRTLPDLAAQGWRDAAEVAVARVRFGATEGFELMLRGRSGRQSLIEMTATQVAASAGGRPSFKLTWAHRRSGRKLGHDSAETELRRLTDALLRMREEERMDVATRLHDDLAPTLVMVKYLVEDALQRIGRADSNNADAPGNISGLLGLAAARLREVIAELRSISTELRPRLLDDLGLIPTLEWYCRGFEEAHPSISITRAFTAAERVIPADLKVEIFRIVQDALGNVARHSQADSVRVALVEEGSQVRLVIEDNGSGFDPIQVARAGGVRVGLPSIRKRIEATGGHMVLESSPRGTHVGAVWPTAALAAEAGRSGDAQDWDSSAPLARARS
jgi:two-component system NarL family sensor kinase